MIEINQNHFCCRYKALAQQYQSMYPTLKIDIDGELLKLKVIKLKGNLKTFSCALCRSPCILFIIYVGFFAVYLFIFYLRTMLSRSSLW